MDLESKSWCRRGMPGALFLFLLSLAAIFRFSGLGRQPLWLDEATDASFAARSFWHCVLAESVHPPLYRTLLHFVVLRFGSSAAVLRFLPALFGVLSVAASVPLARRLFPKTELAAAALVSTSPFLIFFSQENRDYSLLILLTLVSTWAFLRFLETGRGLALYCASCILLVYAHYLAAFVLLAHEVVYWRHARRRMGGWVIARLGVVLAFAPWLFWALRQYHTQSRLFVSPAVLVPTALLRFFLGYGIAAPNAARLAESWRLKLVQDGPIVVPAACLFGWLLWRGARRTSSRETRTLLQMLVFLPWFVLVFFAPWLQLSQERYLAFQAPFLLLVAAAGLSSLPRVQRMLAAAMVAMVIGFALTAYYAAPGRLLGYSFRYAKENWPGAAAFIRRQHAGTVIVAPGYLSLALNRYSLGRAREVRMVGKASVLPDLNGHRLVALVISHPGPRAKRLRDALDSRYRQVSEDVFPSQNRIQVIIYDTSSPPAFLATRPHGTPAGKTLLAGASRGRESKPRP